LHLVPHTPALPTHLKVSTALFHLLQITQQVSSAELDLMDDGVKDEYHLLSSPTNS
jgi:hypothetical protein